MNRNGYFAANIAIFLLWAVEVTFNIVHPKPTAFWLYMLSDAFLWNIIAMSYSRYRTRHALLSIIPPYIAGAGLFGFFWGISRDALWASTIGVLAMTVLPICTVIMAYRVQPR